MLEDELWLLQAKKALLDVISDHLKKRLERIKDAVDAPEVS